MFRKEEYANGQKVYEFNGNTLTYFFKNGKVKSQGIYENELMQGEWKFYHDTGKLWQVGHFVDGKKHGSWTRYDDSGQVEYDETFENGNQVKN